MCALSGRRRVLLTSCLLLVLSVHESGIGQDAGADRIPAADQLLMYDQCREYLTPQASKRACRVDFDMRQTIDATLPPQTHKDITVHLGPDMRGLVVLWRSSPFAVCALSTAPGTLARDLSPNLPTALTAVAGLGGTVGAGALTVQSANLEGAEIVLSAESLSLDLSDADRNRIFQQTMNDMNLTQQQKNNIDKLQPLKKKVQQQASHRIEQEIQQRAAQNAVGTQLKSIQKQEKEINQAFEDFSNGTKAASIAYESLKPILDVAGVIKSQLLYSYQSDRLARLSVDSIERLSTGVVGIQVPDTKSIGGDLRKQTASIEKLIKALQDEYQGKGNVDDFVAKANSQLASARAKINEYVDPQEVAAVAYVTDTQAKIQKILDFVKDWKVQDQRITNVTGKKPNASVQVLPIALYPESKIAVTVKCTDGPTGNQIFDGIQFSAYFQAPPQFDLSAGAVLSTLPNRTVSVQSPSSLSNPLSCTENDTTLSPVVCVAQSSVQFIPGVFAEWHPKNFKLWGVKDPAESEADFVKCERPNLHADDQLCSGATDLDQCTATALDSWKRNSQASCVQTWMSLKAPRHPVGYVGSIGPAGGILINPNSGSTRAEYFAGGSFGIQRFAILFGAHLGQYLDLTNGYKNGLSVTAGTTPTTKTTLRPAFAVGIAYRIPLR